VFVLSILYLIAALLVALYGGTALLLATLYLRRGREPVSPPPEPETWPTITVQLPVYNELYVVTRLIDAVARLDYPRDRLQVQVLDDSTDETTRLARARVAYHQARGLDIELIHRRERSGFKAGALARGLASARGELIALFDADFVPPPDFLRRTVPYLAAQPRLAFVQTRWGYLNAGYSALTRAQTIALDGHFIVEHLGRNRNGLLMNFNGTAGVWRRAAIDDAGGWQPDTLTEDVDLSFRAHLAGWWALYLPEVECPAELPPQIAAFKRQQARWATGAAQCLVKLGGALIKGQQQHYPKTPELKLRPKRAKPYGLRTSPAGAWLSQPDASASGTPPTSQSDTPVSGTWPMNQPDASALGIAPTSQPGASASGTPPMSQPDTTPRLPWPARLEALLHLGVWLAHPMSLVLLLLTLPLLLGQLPLTFNLSIFWLVALGPIVAYALSERHLYPDWKRRMVASMPILALLGTGLALSNTVAIARGLLGGDRDFRRTPKFRIVGRGDRWAGSRYALPFDWLVLGELALAGYALATVTVALAIGNYLAVPFLLLYVGSYGYIGLQGLRDAWAGQRARPRLHRTPAVAKSE
jgi:hypothetical protein